MRRIKQLLAAYRSVILYLVFGVLTTAANIAAYYVCAHPLRLGTLPSTVIAWIIAVFFAYVTNRRWVFHSKEHTAGGVAREVVRFFSCRLGTGVVDWACMFVCVDLLHWDDMLVKFAANVLVVVLNYVASKLLIFRT